VFAISVESDTTAVEPEVDSETSPLEVEVDSEPSPVDSELAVVEVEVDSELSAVDSEVVPPAIVLTEFDSADTVLPVDEITVDSELMPVEVELDSVLIAWLVAYSCEPLTASVLVALTCPAATFVSCRSPPAVPTLTTPTGAVPAYV
jgi:hypothetical protein